MRVQPSIQRVKLSIDNVNFECRKQSSLDHQSVVPIAKTMISNQTPKSKMHP
ncbi:hypothetical protein Fmac_028001 [Flemingia macrophylla]|uniref:Uncharacterized protein n=1 Tax=Flemingia macrophylla TaxID=520843 RepID=A0ABD1LJB6_9FABA